MKKIILCSVLSIMALLYSCNKDIEIESGYQVNVTVDPSDVINTFNSCYEDDFDMLDGDVLRINLFIYDQSGELVEKLHGKCKDYYDEVDFSVKLPKGEYTFVATSDVYTTSDDFAYWEFLHVDNIYDFEIKDLGYMGFDDKMLGLKMLEINVDSPKEILVSLEPAAALLEWHFNNIHACDIIEYEDEYYFVDEYNLLINKNAYSVKIEGNTFGYSVDNSSYYVGKIYPFEALDYDGWYGYSVQLPLNKVELWVRSQFSTIDYSNTIEVSYWIDPVSLNSIKSGKQYVVEIDIENSTMDIELLDEDKASADRNGKESMMKVKNTEMKLMDLVKSNPNLKVDRSQISK